MKKLYCFDFDGTLTYKDTMFMYLKFYDSTKYRIQFLRHVPLFILLKLKLAETEKVKKSFIYIRMEAHFIRILIILLLRVVYGLLKVLLGTIDMPIHKELAEPISIQILVFNINYLIED